MKTDKSRFIWDSPATIVENENAEENKYDPVDALDDNEGDTGASVKNRLLALAAKELAASVLEG